MSLETGTYISDLVATNPQGTDPKSQGDDHLRLIKDVLKNSLPTLSAPLSAALVPVTPEGNIAATNVQAAIVELDTETQAGLATKVAKSGDTMTGGLVVIHNNGVAVQRTGGSTGAALVANADTTTASLFFGDTSPLTFSGASVGFGGATLNTTYGWSSNKPVLLMGGKKASFLESTNNNLSSIQHASFATLTGLVFDSNGTQRHGFGNDGNTAFPYMGLGTGTSIVLDGSGVLRVNSSARKYKKDIEPLGAGLAFVLAMQPVQYNLKETGEAQVGFIADDCPDARLVSYSHAVKGDVSSPLEVEGFNYANYTAILTKAIQELSAKVTALEAQLAAK